MQFAKLPYIQVQKRKYVHVKYSVLQPFNDKNISKFCSDNKYSKYLIFNHSKKVNVRLYIWFLELRFYECFHSYFIWAVPTSQCVLPLGSKSNNKVQRTHPKNAQKGNPEGSKENIFIVSGVGNAALQHGIKNYTGINLIRCNNFIR